MIALLNVKKWRNISIQIFHRMNRQILINKLHDLSGKKWDLIVIGGGATGLGIAVDAASRGYQTLLLEQSDFAKGTSSRSTKLVHGGVRYLAQGDLLLVMEALRERGMMLKNAPHLTFNQEFIIPVYTLWDVILYTVGLKFYDLLAGRLSLGKSRFIKKEETMVRLPNIISKGLKGGIVYHDGQFDDSRMALALAKTCIEEGGLALNYIKVTGLNKDEQGKITGVFARDVVSGDEFNLKAGRVINAAGVFADNVGLMDNPLAKPTIRPSQGVHIVLDKSFLNSTSAIMIPKTSDGRVLFAIPWYDEVVVGTTDTPIDIIDLEPVALEKEIGFILQTAGMYLAPSPKRDDIKCVFAGLRPLAANTDNPASTKEVSRRHKISVSPSGLLTIIGGKWTTYRRMAEETIDKAIKCGFLEKRKCITPGMNVTGLPASEMSNRFHIYGEGKSEIEKLILENPLLGMPIDERFPFTRAEIIYICRNEMPVNIEDILARRTRALLLNAHASSEIASEVVALMAAELGHDQAWQKEQIESYKQLVVNYI